jgi:hypothetical protein
MQELQKMIINRTKSLLIEKIYIPIFYKKVANKMKELKDINQKILCKYSDIDLFKQDDSQPCLAFLHDIGVIIYNKKASQFSYLSKFCINPPLLSKAMSYFMFAKEHKSILFPSTSKAIQSIDKSILSFESIQFRINLLLEQNQIKLNSITERELTAEIIECFQEIEFCFQLSKHEMDLYGCNNSHLENDQQQQQDWFIFPCLRPNGTFQLISNTSVQSLLVCHVINTSNSISIGNNFFFQLQCHLRNIHNPKTELYSNGFRLLKKSQSALLLLSPNATSINIIIQTPSSISPLLFWHEIWNGIQQVAKYNFIGLSISFDYRCPCCILKFLGRKTDDEEKQFDKLPDNILSDEKFSYNAVSKMQDDERICCNNTHHLTKKEILEFSIESNNNSIPVSPVSHSSTRGLRNEISFRLLIIFNQRFQQQILSQQLCFQQQLLSQQLCL